MAADQDELDYVLYLDKEYPQEMKDKKRMEQEAEEEMQATKQSKMLLWQNIAFPNS